MEAGVDGLLRDKTRKPGKAPLAPADRSTRLVELTLGAPPGETTHWTSRAMAKATGIWRSARCSGSGARTAWRRTGCGPSSSSTTRSSPPSSRTWSASMSTRRPMRWCSRSTRRRQIQALDRTQPGLPMKKGRAGTMTHDYKRNGTTTLFAALNVLDGSVIGQCMQRHRHQEFLRFLNRLERDVPAGKLVHVILDNYASHKHPKVLAWLARHPRWTFHFTPTSASWLNAVEGFFAKLTKRRLKRGVFHSLVDLQAAINRYLAEHNQAPKPFVWTADPDAIIAAVSRGYQVLDSIH